MKLSEYIRGSLEYEYAVADKLMQSVDPADLNWKPATGSNWMTTAQLLHHMTNACGFCFKGFVKNDWGMPNGADAAAMSEEEMLPSADKMPKVASVDEARKLLAEDKQLAIQMLESVTEEELNTTITTAPWDAMEMPLGIRLVSMIQHLNQHKGQLFYYLKLQDKPVNTMHLWGM